jgi:hypothetical protein
LRVLPKVLWYMLAVFAFVNAVEALRYLLPHVPFPVYLRLAPTASGVRLPADLIGNSPELPS